MKKALLLALGIVMSASLVFAQGGDIGLYADPAGTECNYVDAAPGLATIYIVHTLTPGATASQFQVLNNWPTATYLSFAATPPNLTLGDPVAGDLAATYTLCAAGPWLIGQMSFFASGVGPTCATLEVAPSVGQVDVLAADCQPSPQFVVATGGVLTINSDGSCPCGPPVSTEEKSWSKIKALYQ